MLLQKYNNLSDKQKNSILQKHYVKNKESFADIAQQFQTYANKIRRDAIKFNIKIRDKSEAQKNALKTGKHKHPTKGQKRDENTKNKIGLKVMESWKNLSITELKKRKEISKKNWDNLSEEAKSNMQHSAHQAVRYASKTGSKLEKFLLDKLITDGYRVDFHKEQILQNTKLHIDLFLPTMNLAIEVDGPSHFEPVWGDDALKKNQKYDNKKTGLLIGKGIKIIRIKQTKDFSKARALLIYNRLISKIKYLQQNNIKSANIGDDD